MSPWNKEALMSMRQELGYVQMGPAGMIKKLEKSYVYSPASSFLGFLSQLQLQHVEYKKTPADQMNKVIDFLLEMEDKYFEYFCQILEQSNFEAKAIMLRARAEECKRSFGKFAISTILACALTLQGPVACKSRNINWLMMSHPDYCLDCVNSYLFYGETQPRSL